MPQGSEKKIMGGTRTSSCREVGEGVLPAESVKGSRVEGGREVKERSTKFEQLLKTNNELMGEMQHGNNLV